MSEPFVWNLTATERRMAEAAFASGFVAARLAKLDAVKAEEAGALLAAECVLAYRRPRTTDSDAAPMLAELRRAPIHPPHCVSEGEHSNVLRALVAAREQTDRYRKLLERVGDFCPCATGCDDCVALRSAVEDIRKELAK